jgi:hypothetical protein
MKHIIALLCCLVASWSQGQITLPGGLDATLKLGGAFDGPVHVLVTQPDGKTLVGSAGC